MKVKELLNNLEYDKESNPRARANVRKTFDTEFDVIAYTDGVTGNVFIYKGKRIYFGYVVFRRGLAWGYSLERLELKEALRLIEIKPIILDQEKYKDVQDKVLLSDI